MSNIRSCFFFLFVLASTAAPWLTTARAAAADRTNIPVPDLNDRCYAPTKPLTDSLRREFVHELEALATEAEKVHGVPAPVFAAMGIKESGYGTTQLAIAANNVLSYKWNGTKGPDGRAVYTLACQPRSDSGNTYVVFRNRADSADFVAGKLATSEFYKGATGTYRTAIANGHDAKLAAIAWLKAIAPSYNPYQTEKYISEVLKIADDPIGQSGHTNAADNLWRLAPPPRQQGAGSVTHAAHVSAVKKKLTGAYAAQHCTVAKEDLLGWPARRLKECTYEQPGTPSSDKTKRLKAYVVLVDIRPEVIATWIETACTQAFPGEGTCFDTLLQCAVSNSSMMFPASGNIVENGRNSFFRNGITVKFDKKDTPKEKATHFSSMQIDMARQVELARAPNTDIAVMPTGLTRLWRTLPHQFAERFPGESAPKKVATPQDREQWLHIAQTELLTALDRPNNRLLEAYVAAHPKTLAAGRCPSKDALP